MTTRRSTRILGAALLTAGLALSLAAAPAGAAVNLLKDGSFEKPVISGAVNVPTGAKIGTCANGAPYPGADYHCWRVGSGTAQLIHDDYLVGGVPVKPKAGAQFVALIGKAADPAGGYVPGELHQATHVAANSMLKLSFWYATMPTPGATSTVRIQAKSCTTSGAACVSDFDLTANSISTGNPANMGWKHFIVYVPVNADQGLVDVSVSSAIDPNAPSTGTPAVDAFSLT